MSPRASSVISWPVPFGGSDPGESPASELPASELPNTPVEERTAPRALPPEWFHDNVASLWRIAARLGFPRHHIDDVLQEAFLIAARRQSEIGAGRERAFLIGTVARLCCNYRRRAHVRHEVSQGEALDEHASREPDAERLLMRKRLRERLDRALDTLSEVLRSVFVLYELEGMSVPEIAELLHLPVGTTASRLGRARAKFAEAVLRLDAAGTEDP
jgi:RNA polymerase sigma-70 factor, ECF subfamily